MALDPSDLIEPPFNIGECREEIVVAPVHCDAWATTDQYMRVVIQKEGDRHRIFFPEYVQYCKLGILTEDCDIIVDLSEWLANDNSKFDITSCRSRHFQGNMQYYNEKEHDDKLGVATVDYDREKGTFTFEPVTNFWLNTNSVAASEVFGVGILPTMIIIDEEFDKWKKEEIEDDFVIPDIDMDYEEKREQYQGGANVLRKITILCNDTAYHDQYMPPIENFEFTMEMELLPDNAYRMTVILPDLLWTGNEASRLKAPVRIKCDALTNRAKYSENKY